MEFLGEDGVEGKAPGQMERRRKKRKRSGSFLELLISNITSSVMSFFLYIDLTGLV